MSALHPGPGLICTTCGQYDCRRAACDSPTQRHLTPEAWAKAQDAESERMAAARAQEIERVQSSCIGPERGRVLQATRMLRRLPVSQDPRVALETARAIEQLHKLYEAMSAERSELVQSMSWFEILDRDASVRHAMLGVAS